LVKSVFNSVAKNYDLMNDIMSLGIHRAWKSEFISRLNPLCVNSLLDIAGGTGDISFKFMKKAQKFNKKPKIIISDINQEMLDVGKKRAIDKGFFENIDFIKADAQNLPFEDNSFDACTISFGLRNVTNIDKALSEMYRILKPNGIFLCLEFSKVIIPVLDKIYDQYSFKVIPNIGKIVAKDKESYQYLVESIRQFPTQDKLAKKMYNANFSNIEYQNLTGGIAAIHIGKKDKE
jgi:demethylmenaquinone methyltransferase/2-methoxy-6-polyprenyl-1,4-benzoquinol methylase